MRVDFYHLTRTPIERALPRLAERIVGEGGRLLIVSSDAEQRRVVDRALWTFSPESFVPHAEAGKGDDAVQPVLLSDGTQAANGARTVALIDGVWRDSVLDFDRALHFFGDDHIGPARRAWRALGERGEVERCYRRQTDRGWEQVA